MKASSQRLASIFVRSFSVLSVLLSCGHAAALSFLTYPPQDMGNGTIETPVIVQGQGAEGVSAFQAEIVYDPSILNVSDVLPGALFDGLVDFNVMEPGKAKVALATTQSISGDGEILRIVSEVLSGEETMITLDKCQAWGEEGQELAIDVASDVQEDLQNVARAQSLASKLVPLIVMGVFLLGLVAVGVILFLVFRARKPRPGRALPARVPGPPPLREPDEPPTLVMPGKPVPPPPPSRPLRPGPPVRENLLATQPLPDMSQMDRAVPSPKKSTSSETLAPKCSSCGHPLEAGAKFCSECGTAAQKVCSGCQEPVPAGAKFCPKCGQRVASGG